MPAPAIVAETRDEDLMLAYAAGDAAAFDVLYARHKGSLYRYVLRQCAHAGVAEELFQDVWMNVLRARASYVPSARFATWLYRIAHNRLIDHWRATGQVELVSAGWTTTTRSTPSLPRAMTSPTPKPAHASARRASIPRAPRCRRCSARRSCCIRKADSSSRKSRS
jgi:RNA polymerase sigma factor (sigma-70 family)